MRWLMGNWRPRLGSVVLGILLTVLALPLVGLFFFRLYENTLIRQTEAELIAQGATLSAIFGTEIEKTGILPDRFGPEVRFRRYEEQDKRSKILPSEGQGVFVVYGRYTPIEPKLDLAVDPVLPPRPDPKPAISDPEYAALGVMLSPILAETQRVTLAGFKLLDPRGVTVAGSQEVGMSLAHVPEVAQALAGRYASVLRQRISDQAPPSLYSLSRGTKVRVFVAMPVIVSERVAGVVYLSRTPNNIVKHLYGERGKVALAALAMLAATLLIGFVFVRLISRPITELLERTQRIADGDADALRPLSHHGTKEMAGLAAGFLDMARKLQARSDTLKTFATHVSHELKSPLTSIQGAAELLREGGEDMSAEERRRFHDNIAEDSQRLNALVRRLIELARAENAESGGQATTLAETVNQVVPGAKLTVRSIAGGDVSIQISSENLGIILTNLAENSASHGASALLLSATRSGNDVLIAAQDDGEGVAAEDRERIFEPFFTTRREAGGTGLGLGIVTALLKTHNGSIELADSTRGARFEIVLPAAWSGL